MGRRERLFAGESRACALLGLQRAADGLVLRVQHDIAMGGGEQRLRKDRRLHQMARRAQVLPCLLVAPTGCEHDACGGGARATHNLAMG